MENTTDLLNKVAELNPCVDFIVRNYDLLCVAYPNKVVMVMDWVALAGNTNAYVARTFDSMVDALMFVDAMAMDHVPFALKLCDGSDVDFKLTISKACRTPN